MGQFESLGLPFDYECEVDPEFPGAGSWGCDVFAFGSDSQGNPKVMSSTDEFRSPWGSPLVIKVETSHRRWVGYFEAGMGGPTRVVASPDPHTLCALCSGAAYLIPVEEPSEMRVLPSLPAREIAAVPEIPLIVLADWTHMVAVGQTGQEWRSQRLCLDGLHILEARTDAIRCEGDFVGSVEEFAVDPRTGRQFGGPELPPPLRT